MLELSKIKRVLKDQIKDLKEKVDQMSIADPSITLASKVGNLLVKELELKKVQEELEEAKQDILDKCKLLVESFAEKDNLRRQVEAIRQELKDAKSLLWDNITKEFKKSERSSYYVTR